MSNQIDPIQEHLDYVLRKFCKKEVWQDSNKWQLEPSRSKNKCAAMDSYFMLIFEECLFPTPPCYPEHDNPLADKIDAHCRAHHDMESYDVDDLEAICDECERLNDEAGDDNKHVIYLAPDAISVRVMRRVVLAARLLGASSIIIDGAEQAGQMRKFGLFSKESDIAYGIFMPLRYDDKYNLHTVQQSIFGKETAVMNLEAGMKYRADMEAAEEQARKEYEASKKVWRVQVVKSAWIPVQAVTAQEAMKLAQEHSNGVDDDMFEDSDVSVEACESYPMETEDVEDLQDNREANRQGILTAEGWKSWSAYYGNDDPDDEYHKSTMSVKVTFGK